MDYKKYFKNNKQLLEKLEDLHAKKYRLKSLLSTSSSIEPFTTEFSGLPRTGKTTCVERVYEFFKIDTTELSEIETSIIIADKIMDGVSAKILSRSKN